MASKDRRDGVFAPLYPDLSQDLLEYLTKEISIVEMTEEVQHHFHVGLDQLKRYMAFNFETGISFLEYVQRDSSIWSTLVQTVAHTKHLRANLRPVIPQVYADGATTLAPLDLCTNSHGRPDDRIYKKHAFCRKMITRGQFVARWACRDSEHDSDLYFPLLRAYPKFSGHEDGGELTGSFEDAESFSSNMSLHFLEPIGNATHVLCTRKENGENGHVSILKKSDDNFLFAIGSKNVHMLIRDEDDIEEACMYGNTGGNGKNDSYAGARPIAKTFMNALNKLTDKNRKLFCEFLAQTRVTVSFEVLLPSRQHVERLPEEESIVIFGTSLPLLRTFEDAEICFNPVFFYELFRCLGLTVVPYNLIAYKEYELRQPKCVRDEHGLEGYVHVFLNMRGVVIGLQKSKTAWYVSLRAIREQIKSFLAYSRKESHEMPDILKHFHLAITKRFESIQSYLCISKDTKNFYHTLARNFLNYVSLQVAETTPSGIEALQEKASNQFPILWHEFLLQTNTNDRFDP